MHRAQSGPANTASLDDSAATMPAASNAAEFFRAHRNDFLCCSSWSSDAVRSRFALTINREDVLVIACKGLGLERHEVAHPLPEAVYLVERDRYEASSGIYVIDEDRDRLVDPSIARRVLAGE